MESIIVDEFGRNTHLRVEKSITNPSPSPSLPITQKKSWAEICWEIEEAEEMAELEHIKTLTQERLEALEAGMYELEEGEILE